MRNWVYILAIGTIQVLIFSLPLGAKAAPLTNSETLFVNNNVICGLENESWLPGEIRGANRFISFLKTIAKLKLRIRKAFGQTRDRLVAQRKTAEKRHRKGLKICKNGPPLEGGNPTPTPTPTPPPGGAPNPQPTPVAGCFDAGGNTTCFGIGNGGLIGNLTEGKNIWERGNGLSTSCDGCHHESTKRNKTFQQIQDALVSVPEMTGVGDNVSSADIADIVAYLNRFNN